MTKYNITLDVWHQIPETVVTAMQGEINSRFLEITITDKGNFFNLTGKTVMVYMTKPDGKIIFNSCSVVDAPNGKINVNSVIKPFPKIFSGYLWPIVIN